MSAAGFGSSKGPPRISATEAGAAAAAFTPDGDVVVSLFDQDGARRTSPVAVGTFAAPRELFVVALPAGGALALVLSNEGNGEKWFASFVDPSGALHGAPEETSLDPDELVRDAAPLVDGSVALLQYPEYLPGGAPEDAKPLVVSSVSIAHPSVCPLRVDLHGYVDPREEVTFLDPDHAGAGFLVSYVDGPKSPLPPLGRSKTVLLRDGAVRGVARPPQTDALTFMFSMGTTSVVRMNGAVSDPTLPAIDASPVIGPKAPSIDQVAGDAAWTGKRMLMPFQTEQEEAEILAIDCTP